MKPHPEQIKEIFAQALRMSAAEQRERYLSESCQASPELRREVDSLLRAHEQAGDFLGQTIQLPAADFESELLGTMIGRYKLLEKIGEGGFGVVYMAEQQEPVQRKVALKIIKAGMETREVIARFEAERQALALMDHPNIAKVLDAGTTEARRPYFVMELVRGIPMTEYCDQNNLSTVQRLQLFIRVCQAVQHAHQKAVIHRDLKPSNILVTLHDGEPVPKVIDFGVAKALGQKLTEKTLFTSFRQMIGTPAYMSPEQAEMSGLDVDTRSDIYSLGVLLYELLTGVTPFDKEILAKAAFDEIRRMICETDPPKPSTRLQTLGARLAEVARHRRAEPAALSRHIHGDLDWIVMKCLDKDRRRRYETASGLAMDVDRHIQSQPVLARPPSNFYRFQKLVRRNKLAFGMAGAITAIVILGLGFSAYLFVQERIAKLRAASAERAALQQSERSRETASALRSMLKDLIQPNWRPEDAESMFLILWRANRSLQQMQLEPEIEAELWELLGDAALRICQFPSREVVERGEITARFGRASGPDELLGWVDPRDIYKKVVQFRQKQSGPNALETALACFKLSKALLLWGNLEEAEAMASRALQIETVTMGTNNVLVAENERVLGTILRRRGRLEEAEHMHLRAWASWTNENDFRAWDSLYELAVTRQIMGKSEEARLLAQKLLTIVEDKKKDGIDQHGYVPPFNIGGTTSANYDYYRCKAYAALAQALIDLRRFNEAESYASVNLSIITNSMRTWSDWTSGEAKALLGGALLGKERFEQAETLLVEGANELEALKSRAEPFCIRQCLRWLVQLYEPRGPAGPGADKLNTGIFWKKRLEDFERSLLGQ